MTATAQPSETTASNQVATALKETIAAHLGSYITLPTGFDGGHVHLISALLLQAAQSPAICIDEQGDIIRQQYANGMGAEGETSPGFQERVFKFDIEIWVEGKYENASVRVNIWRDAICALLNDYEKLGNRWVAVKVQTSSQVIDGTIGSQQFWGSVVKCDVVAGTFRGVLALADGTPVGL